MRKEQRRLARQKASREGLPSILVVCEGRETQPNSIDGLRDHLRINAAAVHIERGDSVTDPVGLVRKAQKLFKGDREACRRVGQLKAELRANGASAPDTDMHFLVEQFRRMQRP